MRNNQGYNDADSPAIRGVQFSPLEADYSDGSQVSPGSIDMLKDVPLSVHAELGRTKMLVKDILRLGVGSVIELEKETGEPLDLMVNNKTIARGEVVEIDGNFGIRVTEIPGR